MRGSQANILAYAQLTQREVIQPGDLCGPLGLTPKQERELLSRLARKGLLVRLKRGAYLVPMRMPPMVCRISALIFRGRSFPADECARPRM